MSDDLEYKLIHLIQNFLKLILVVCVLNKSIKDMSVKSKSCVNVVFDDIKGDPICLLFVKSYKHVGTKTILDLNHGLLTNIKPRSEF